MNVSENQTPALNRSFSWLNATQFLGALNDNIFQLLVTFFLIRSLPHERSGDLVARAGLIFALPFLLFTPAAGVLADRISKRTIVVWAKILEIVCMATGGLAFLSGRPAAAYGVLFLMSAQSALFGPAKFGILPELVRKEQLSRANALIVAFTYLAIIFGAFLGPAITEATRHRMAWAALLCMGIALAGTLTSLPIERTPPAGSTSRVSPFFFVNVWRTLRAIRGDRFLLTAVLAAAFFSFVGAFLKLNIIPYGIEHLGLTDTQSGKVFLAAALGIGLGSLAAGRLSGRNVEFGVVPVGALALAVAALLLFPARTSWPAAVLCIALAGFGAGLFIVPLDAFIQIRSPRDKLGEVLAAKGFLDWTAILLSSAALLLLGRMHLTPAERFVVIGGLTLALTLVTIRILPDFLVRLAAVLITRLMYRIRAVGVENLPVEGGALLVSNHVSFMDAVQILATQQRRIRFLMHRPVYEGNRLRPLFRLMGVIPIAMEDPPRKIVESLKAARQALDDGYMVCIFAEGALTRNGLMRGFKPGFERIVKGTDYPIIPVYIGGAWGSIFSHYYGKQHARLPARWPYPIDIYFGRPLPSTTRAHKVRQAVSELSCRYFDDRKAGRRPLGEQFARVARRNWSRHAVSDMTGRRLTYGGLLVGALALSRPIRRLTGGQKQVGVLLPPSVGGVLANLALTLLHKVPVNLNYVASKEAFRSAIRQAGIETIISSAAFLERFPDFAALPGLARLEDLVQRVTVRDRWTAALRGRWWPVRRLRRARFSPDDPATLMFSSGTTGEPKGVMLSHHNIASNAESTSMVFRPRHDDNLCAVLPLFHSFGYTCGLWFPLLTGMAATYHANPLDGGKVGELVRANRCTAIFTTPTFLLSYLRKMGPDDLRTLRHVVVGAEKLRPQLADAFEEKFGIRPREGYGATELSPVAALSLPDSEVGGIFQSGSKPGSVGQPVPGVAVRIVDPETFVPQEPDTPGLMLVRGPNVMLGYLNRPDLTAQALRDGWYVTGDIASVDSDGFIRITDRLSRFSKIGGEMVPHIAVEDEYLRGLGRSDPVLAVASVPDEKKGERLVVLYTAAAGDPAALRDIIARSPIPNLWKPARENYFPLDALPLTGSGKLDVKALRRAAEAAIAAAASEAQADGGAAASPPRAEG